MWGRNKAVAAEIPEKILQRVEKLSTSDLIAWADQALYTTGRYLTAHIKDSDPALMDEARTGAQVLLAIADELKRRG